MLKEILDQAQLAAEFERIKHILQENDRDMIEKLNNVTKSSELTHFIISVHKEDGLDIGSLHIDSGNEIELARIDDSEIPRIDDSQMPRIDDSEIHGMDDNNPKLDKPPKSDGFGKFEDFEQMTPVNVLQKVFPDYSLDKIDAALASNNYNIESALDSLLAKQNTDTPKQICRHFLVGQCYRSDCWFSHQVDGVVCKFWLKGTCTKGSQCQFSHGNGVAGNNNVQSQIPLELDKSDFPALVQSKPKMDFLSPVNYNQKAQGTLKSKKLTLSNPTTPPPSKKKIMLNDVKWVSTGDSLSASYLEYRQDAIQAAIERNKLVQKATQAYLQGNKAAAKALSLAAAQTNTQVEQLHNEAATKIFQTRNSAILDKGEATIDLHGLHPNESVKMVQQNLETLQKMRYKGKVSIITGTGHHSNTQQKAKVSDVVWKYLSKAGHNPVEGTMNDRFGGIIVVFI